MALRTILDEPEWTDYLVNLGIPKKWAKEYAVNFAKQQVPTNLLSRITDTDLRDTYGIQLGGHRLTILHSAAQTPAMELPAVKTSKPQVRHKAPQLKPIMTPSAFRAFISHWTVYKGLVGIPHDSPNAAAQLFSLACTDNPEIRQTISDY